MSRGEDETQIHSVREAFVPTEGSDASYVVVLSGRSVGRMFLVTDGEMLIGRSPDAQVILDDDGVSRRHARLLVQEGDITVFDLESTNGTFVEGERVGHAGVVLSDGDRIRVGPNTILKYGYQDTVERQFLAQLYQSAARDDLTGVHNKRFFLDHLAQEIAYHRRHAEPLTLIFLDIDHFKKVNDRYGHQAGDAVLKEVALLLDRASRAEDMVARYGGEEFAIVLRSTPAREGRALAERLRVLVEQHEFRHRDRVIPVTISLGVNTRAGDVLTTPASLVEEVDRWLYWAKANGRNLVGWDREPD